MPAGRLAWPTGPTSPRQTREWCLCPCSPRTSWLASSTAPHKEAHSEFPRRIHIFKEMTPGVAGHYTELSTQDSNHSGLQRQLRLHGHQGHGMLSLMGKAVNRDILGVCKSLTWACTQPEKLRKSYESSSENKSLLHAWSVVGWGAQQMISMSSDVDEMTCMVLKSLALPRPRLLGRDVVPTRRRNVTATSWHA